MVSVSNRQTYRAVAKQDGRGWRVSIEGVTWPARFVADDLVEVEAKARKLIWGFTGAEPDGVEVVASLPPVVEDRLSLIADTCADLDTELCAARRELRELGLSNTDVASVLEARYRPPSVDGGCW